SERPDRDRLCPSGSFPDADGLQERAYRLAGTPGFQLARTPDGRWPGRPTAARASSSPAEAQRPRAGQEPHMFEHHLAALIGLSQARDLAYSALPDAPVQPHQEGRKAERDRRRSQPAPPAGAAAAAPAHRPVAAGPAGSPT